MSNDRQTVFANIERVAVLQVRLTVCGDTEMEQSVTVVRRTSSDELLVCFLKVHVLADKNLVRRTNSPTETVVVVPRRCFQRFLGCCFAFWHEY